MKTRVRICLRSRARCRLLTRPLPSPPPPPTQEEQGPTVLTCLRPPVSHTAWSTGRSRWTCATSVQTADSRPRSPARCSTTLAASAPTMRMRSGGRFGLISLASKHRFHHVFNLGRFCVLIFLVLLISQRFPTDRAYFIAKELLTTERTYVKDLEVVTVVRGDRIVSPVCVFGLALYSVEENIDYSALLLRCRTPVKTKTQGRLGRWDYFICHSIFHLDLAACSLLHAILSAPSMWMSCKRILRIPRAPLPSGGEDIIMGLSAPAWGGCSFSSSGLSHVSSMFWLAAVLFSAVCALFLPLSPSKCCCCSFEVNI